jgi:hypothetical protein
VPDVPLGLFDLYCGHTVQEPSQVTVRRVRAAGGTVVQRFHVNGVRALLPPHRVALTGAVRVLGVQEPGEVMHRLSIGFHTQVDGRIIYEGGGYVLWASSPIPNAVVMIPDRLVPALLRHPDLRFIAMSEVGCGSLGGPPH